MENVTVEQVQQAVQERGITLWKLRECSICLAPLTYAFGQDGITYDRSCGCVTYSEPPEPRTWEDVAKQFNIQKPEIRKRMWGEFLASGDPSPPKDQP